MSHHDIFNVLIEIPRGSRNKYEMDHDTNMIKLDRTLFTAMGYPDDYGYILDTLSEDGDPLDALVMDMIPTFPGCTIKSRVVGLFHMEDEHGLDDKILCVPDDPRYDNIQDIDDISEFHKKEIENFFANYKTIEPGKQVQPDLYFANKDRAMECIEASRERLKNAEH